MKNYILGLFIVLAASAAAGQTSVGYTNNENIQPLIQYRLPDWGYSNLFLDFDVMGHGVKTEPKQTDIRTNFHPYFIRYLESEERIGVFTVSPEVNYRYRNISEFSNPTSKNIDLSYYIHISWYQYISKEMFLAFDGSTYGNFYQQYKPVDMKRWSIQSSPVFGLGWGRIRNVNPMLRALRFEERYSAVNSGANFSSDNRQTVARMFAQERGYNAIHDRSRKYFWDDFYQEMPSLQSGLTPYDYFYLNEVFQESLGNRYEGWDIRLLFEYTHRQNKYGPSQVNTDPSGGISLRYRFFKNLNLDHQIELRSMLHYQFSLKRNDPIVESSRTYDFNLHAVIGHLWVISDRLLLNTNLSGMVQLVESEIAYHEPVYELSIVGPADWWTNQEGYQLQTVLSYFIEDRISIDTNLELDSMRANDGHNTTWNCSIGVTYYIFRNLF